MPAGTVPIVPPHFLGRTHPLVVFTESTFLAIRFRAGALKNFTAIPLRECWIVMPMPKAFGAIPAKS